MENSGLYRAFQGNSSVPVGCLWKVGEPIGDKIWITGISPKGIAYSPSVLSPGLFLSGEWPRENRNSSFSFYPPPHAWNTRLRLHPPQFSTCHTWLVSPVFPDLYKRPFPRLMLVILVLSPTGSHCSQRLPAWTDEVSSLNFPIWNLCTLCSPQISP
jgi:hypothetical protein